LGVIINSVNIALTPKQKSDVYALAVETQNKPKLGNYNRLQKLMRLLWELTFCDLATSGTFE